MLMSAIPALPDNSTQNNVDIGLATLKNDHHIVGTGIRSLI